MEKKLTKNLEINLIGTIISSETFKLVKEAIKELYQCGLVSGERCVSFLINTKTGAIRKTKILYSSCVAVNDNNSDELYLGSIFSWHLEVEDKFFDNVVFTYCQSTIQKFIQRVRENDTRL